MTSKRRVQTPTQAEIGLNQSQTYGKIKDPSPIPSQPFRRAVISTSGLETYLQLTAPMVLAVTYWFDPPLHTNISSYTIQMTGKRIDLTGRPQPADRFVHLESVDGVVDGSGPVAVMAKIHGVNPGKWDVSARMVPPHHAVKGQQLRATGTRQVVLPIFRAAWSWKKWNLSVASEVPINTCRAPFAQPPAVILGSWAALVAVGIVSALFVQMWVAESLKLNVGSRIIEVERGERFDSFFCGPVNRRYRCKRLVHGLASG